MDKPEQKQLRFPARLTVLILAAAVICAVLPVLPVQKSLHETAGRAWRPILRFRDRTAIALGSDTIGNVYLTKERMLRKTEQYDESRLSEAVEAINAFADTAGQTVYLLAAPTAAGIYADTLPEQAPQADERAMLQRVASALGSNVSWIETYSRLSSVRDEAIFFRTDSRWTAYGAYCAYKSAARKLGYTAVGFDQIEVTHFCSDYCGNLAQELQYGSGVFASDLIDLYSVQNAPEVIRIAAVTAEGETELGSYFDPARAEQTGDPYDVYALAAEPVLRAETNRMAGKSILMISDSGGASFLPLLFAHYRSVTAVNLEKSAGTGWRDLVMGADADYQQILILCSADFLAAGSDLKFRIGGV